MPGPPSELRRSLPLSKRAAGVWGEELALRYLTERGYELVERYYRTRQGELDLILEHGFALVFVKVKRHLGVGFGDSLEI